MIRRHLIAGVIACAPLGAPLLVVPDRGYLADAVRVGVRAPVRRVEVVFARGRMEPPGIGILGNAFVSALRSKTNKNIGVYAVRYPADTEIDIGANDMSAHIQYMANNCPDTRLVLGGYSLGAAVTDVVLAVPFDFFGFTNPLPPGMDQHIAAVALFGNGAAWAGPITNFNPLYRDRTIESVSRRGSRLQPSRPEHLGRQLVRTISPTRTSRQAWRIRPPTSSRARL